MWFALAALLAVLDVTDRQTQSVALPQGKAITIDITIGSVRIEGWDRPDVADIVVERRAPAAADRARLPLHIEDTPSRLVIRALQDGNGTDPRLRADITIRLPRASLVERVQIVEGRLSIEGLSGSITASISRGPIDAQNLSGAVRLSTEIGAIALSGAQLSDGGLLRLRTFNGDIKLTLAQRPAHARIMALALNGTIKSTIPLQMRDSWGPRWGEATLGNGEPVISLDVVNGTIELKTP